LIEKVAAAGLSALAGSSVAIPIPAPSIVSKTWTTSATTTPAKIAPQATRLIMIVWASSAAVGWSWAEVWVYSLKLFNLSMRCPQTPYEASEARSGRVRWSAVHHLEDAYWHVFRPTRL